MKFKRKYISSTSKSASKGSLHRGLCGNDTHVEVCEQPNVYYVTLNLTRSVRTVVAKTQTKPRTWTIYTSPLQKMLRRTSASFSVSNKSLLLVFFLSFAGKYSGLCCSVKIPETRLWTLQFLHLTRSNSTER